MRGLLTVLLVWIEAGSARSALILEASRSRNLLLDSCSASVGHFCAPGATQCSAGHHHTVCTTTENSVLTFGKGGDGALGHGNVGNRLSPTAVVGLAGVRSCSAGSQHTVCTLTNSSVVSFGTYGALGHGTDPFQAKQLTPKIVAGLEGVRACSAGNQFSVCTMQDSSVVTFGIGALGQLGHGMATVEQQVPRAVAGLSGVSSCAAGLHHTVCTMEDGSVKTCGGGSYGELGHGVYESLSTPRTVPGLAAVRSCT
jgi:alpha-tubulin suppressor-like RCC1 family protein